MNSSPEENYVNINRELWNQRTAVHLKSEFYDVAGFIAGKSSLNAIELDFLGDLKGKKVLHLQCHFGQDSISLARLGATVVGVDLSDKAIEAANDLAQKANVQATFLCCDLYELPQFLNDKFDLVYTSYGTIGWLPDLNRWANIVSHFLKSEGKFVFVEFHPVVWMFDNDFKSVAYRYFTSEPIVEIEYGTYADKEAPIQNECVTWNHGLAEVVTSLLNQNLEIKRFEEYDYSPYNCFSSTEEFEPGKFRIQQFGDKIPMVYALEAKKLA